MKKDWEDGFIPVSRIKGSGWTTAAIKKFLGEPDKVMKNPYYASNAMVNYYSIRRIKEIESSDLFIEFVKKNEKRILGTKKTTEKRKQARIKKIKETEFEIVKLPIRELFRRTFNQYNKVREFFGSEVRVSVRSNRKTKKVLLEKYISNNLVLSHRNYSESEENKKNSKPDPGYYKKYVMLLYDAYPWLKDY
ncbi:hypothetical protein V6Z05_18105 [Leptospira venezuelensis]|uniref:hypothetical protein n=1 Tax=Leptospira venezuelensis TaxID=1958811 RepID=UPI000A37D831|nr:hypothetical protein [Leptospira venezuelensis]